MRLDIKRRQVMGDTITSPLVDLVDPNAPATERDPGDAPTALDLTDVTAASIITTAKQRQDARPSRRPATEPVTTPAAAGGEDVSDWI